MEKIVNKRVTQSGDSSQPPTVEYLVQILGDSVFWWKDKRDFCDSDKKMIEDFEV